MIPVHESELEEEVQEKRDLSSWGRDPLGPRAPEAPRLPLGWMRDELRAGGMS